MSRLDDHFQEMSTHTISDEAVEAFFSGFSGFPGLGSSPSRWEQEGPLAMLADDVALAVSGPGPRPDHALLQLFWSTAAPPPEPEAHRGPAPVGRFRLAVGALLASVMAFTGVGVAGAVGVLPAPVERAVAGVVETVTPFELPGPDADRSRGARGPEPSQGRGLPGPVPAPVAGVPPHRPPASGPVPTPVPGPGAPVPAGADRPSQPPPGVTPAQSAPGPPPAAGLDRAGQAPVPAYAPASGPRPPAGPPPGRP